MGGDMRAWDGRRGITAWLNDLWYREPGRRGVPAPLETVCGGAYALALKWHQRRMRAEARRLPAFVISIGNLVVGGTGKTPMVLHVARALAEAGEVPAVLSRGYGGRSSSVARVNPSEESSINAGLYGDEPALLASRLAPLPVWVGRERWRSGLAAIETDGARILILDDGFQHMRLERNLDIVLLDARLPFGNGSLLPLGPLREPRSHLERAHAIILTRAEDPVKTAAAEEMLGSLFPGKPVFTCRHKPGGLLAGREGRPLPPERVRGRRVLAFAGIAHPSSFFSSLETLGLEVAAGIGFPDHHFYGAEELHGLLDTARGLGASLLVTTEKDHVRLPPDFRTFVLRTPVELDFGPLDAGLRDFITGAVSAHFLSVGS